MDQTRITSSVNYKHGLAEPLAQKMKDIIGTDDQHRMVVPAAHAEHRPPFPMDPMDKYLA